MSDKITGILSIVKENDIFHTDIWARILIIVLYTDIFLGHIAPFFNLKINELSDMVNGGCILLYIISAMLAIIAIGILTASMHITFMMYIMPWIMKHSPQERVSTNRISAQHLKEFALLDKNDIAYRISCDLKKSQDKLYHNTMIKYATAILIGLDLFFGLYMEQLLREKPVFQGIILVVSFTTVAYQALKYYGRKDWEENISLSSKCIKKMNEIIYGTQK